MEIEVLLKDKRFSQKKKNLPRKRLGHKNI
jgi:hypothetical protein